MLDEPWYGVKMVYQLKETPQPAFEERVIIVRADSFDAAIAAAEKYSRGYEREEIVYTGFATAFHIFDENGPALGPGIEVFSEIRVSTLDVAEYLNRFYDTGEERIEKRQAGSE